MRPSPRLSLLAILSGLVLASMPAWAEKIEFNLTDANERQSLKDAGWTTENHGEGNGTGNSAGIQFNGKSEYIATPDLGCRITNLVITARTTGSFTRPIIIFTNDVAMATYTGIAQGTTGDLFNIDFGPDSLVNRFKIQSGTTGGYQIYFRKITIYTVDPPPSLGPVADQTIGSDNTIERLPLLAASTVPGDVLSVTVSTADALSAASYGVFSENSDWFFRFSPSTAGVTSGQFTFIASATGIGGTTNVPFAVTVTEGVVKTPPTIDAIDDQAVVARRRLTVPFTVREADGDSIVTNVVCRTANVEGPYGRDAAGAFFFEPTLADALLGAIDFRIVATDSDDMVGYEDFSVSVTVGSPPHIGSIAPQTVAYGGTNHVTLALMPTDDDDITYTNVAAKAETLAPEGEYTYSNLVFRFAPAAADIGQTFSFTASATDLDGTTANEFDVTVILAAPVLKHCPVEDWTPTSFTADIEEAVPGATSYNLRYIHHEDDGTPVTNTIPVTSLHYVVSGLATTNYVYDVQAIRGAVTSAWSNAESIDLHAWVPYEPAIRMTKDGGGVYTQEFDTLIKSGTGKWYDGRTLPGWHTCWYGRTITDTTVNYEAFKYNDDNSHQGFFSFEIDRENPGNRAFGMRNDAQNAYAQIGIAFTNECRYAVTNVFISFTAAQFRDATGDSWLRVQYAKTDAVRSLHQGDWPEGQTWKNASALDFKAPQKNKAQEMEPDSERRSGNIALTGNDAIQPGEVLLIQWWMDENNKGAPLGIDHLRIEWRCAWPRHTVIMLQ